MERNRRRNVKGHGKNNVEKIIGVVTIVVDATTKMKELQEKANKNKNYIKND